MRLYSSFLQALIAGAVAAGTFVASAQAAPTLEHIRGTVVKASATSVTIATAEGNTTVGLAPSSVILGCVPAKLSDIKPNSFIGISNTGPSNDARAAGVFILPEALRAGFEGSAPWDLPATSSHMTNGNASAVSHMTNGMAAGSHMTNGTLSRSSSDPLRLSVAYKGGSIDAVIPPNTPVVRAVPATWKTLAPGAHVFVAAHPVNNSPMAALVTVGEGGVVPPM